MPTPPAPSIDALLSRVALFSSLNPEEIGRIARGTREINAGKGDILFHKGDLPTGFHLIAHADQRILVISVKAHVTPAVVDHHNEPVAL